MVFTALWNWAIERLAYRPLRGSFRLAPLISAIGMSIFLSNFVHVAQGPRNKSVPPMFTASSSFFTKDDVYDVTLSYKQILIVAVTAVLLAGVLVSGRQNASSAARSAPASRTRRWRRCSASTSTAPSP